MAITISNAAAKVVNRADGIVADGHDIAGGYFVTDISPVGKLIKDSEESKASPSTPTHNIPAYAFIEGALCYCTEDNEFYQYDGIEWKIKKFESEYKEAVENGAEITAVTTGEKYTWNNKIDKNTAITGATKCKITYDADGLVTAGADLAASDIPNLDADKITSGTFTDARIASASNWNAKYDKPASGIPASDLVDLAADKITAMTGYNKPASTSAIVATDSLNTAIGKLETAIDKLSTTDATKEVSGLMSAADKTNLDKLVTAWTADGDDDQLINKVEEVVKAFENAPEGTSIVTALAEKADNKVVTGDTAGLMSAADKLKLDSIEAGANVNIADCDETVTLKTDLYAYTNIGKITASNTSRKLVAEAGKTIKDVFNAVFGTQEDVNPDIYSSGAYLSCTSAFSRGGGEYGTKVNKEDVTITFTLNNSCTAQYGYRCGSTKTTTSNASFKYAITKQSNADIKITLPSGKTAASSMVTAGTCVSVSGNVLYCNFNSSNKVSIKISLEEGSVTLSQQTRYGSISGSVIFGEAQTSSGTKIDKFLTFLGNDVDNIKYPEYVKYYTGGEKTDSTGSYTISAGSYYKYYLASTTSSLSSDINNPVTTATKFTTSTVNIKCDSASHIWFLLPPGTSGSKSIQYEPFANTWVDAFGGATDTTVGPVDVALELESGVIVVYKGYYTSAKAAAGSDLNYKIV